MKSSIVALLGVLLSRLQVYHGFVFVQSVRVNAHFCVPSESQVVIDIGVVAETEVCLQH